MARKTKQALIEEFYDDINGKAVTVETTYDGKDGDVLAADKYTVKFDTTTVQPFYPEWIEFKGKDAQLHLRLIDSVRRIENGYSVVCGIRKERLRSYAIRLA